MRRNGATELEQQALAAGLSPAQLEALCALPRTPEAAKAQGLRTYFPGRPCGNGHLSERSIANNRCRMCAQGVTRRIKQRRMARSPDLEQVVAAKVASRQGYQDCVTRRIEAVFRLRRHLGQYTQAQLVRVLAVADAGGADWRKKLEDQLRQWPPSRWWRPDREEFA